jgi:hypothetical protein
MRRWPLPTARVHDSIAGWRVGPHHNCGGAPAAFLPFEGWPTKRKRVEEVDEIRLSL